MAIEFVCPACRGTLRVEDDAAGQTVRCGECMAVLRVPQAEPAVSVVEPVAPPAELVVESDEPAPRPRRRTRRPARPKGRSVGFWVLTVLLTTTLFTLLVCGGVMLAGRPQWRIHESAAGGFRVELPAAPRPDIAQMTRAHLPPGVRIEGTVLLLKLEQYAVVYRDIEPATRQTLTDDDILAEAVKGIKDELPTARLVRDDRVTVSGFPGREVVMEVPGQETGVWRVVVAETRLYVVLDSFVVTDPQLLARRRPR